MYENDDETKARKTTKAHTLWLFTLCLVSRSVYISVLGRPGFENGVGVVVVC